MHVHVRAHVSSMCVCVVCGMWYVYMCVWDVCGVQVCGVVCVVCSMCCVCGVVCVWYVLCVCECVCVCLQPHVFQKVLVRRTLWLLWFELPLLRNGAGGSPALPVLSPSLPEANKDG